MASRRGTDGAAKPRHMSRHVSGVEGITNQVHSIVLTPRGPGGQRRGDDNAGSSPSHSRSAGMGEEGAEEGSRFSSPQGKKDAAHRASELSKGVRHPKQTSKKALHRSRKRESRERGSTTMTYVSSCAQHARMALQSIGKSTMASGEPTVCPDELAQRLLSVDSHTRVRDLPSLFDEKWFRTESHLTLRGCPSATHVKNAFVAAKAHSELGGLLELFATATVNMFESGVDSEACFSNGWYDLLSSRLSSVVFDGSCSQLTESARDLGAPVRTASAATARRRDSSPQRPKQKLRRKERAPSEGDVLPEASADEPQPAKSLSSLSASYESTDMSSERALLRTRCPSVSSQLSKHSTFCEASPQETRVVTPTAPASASDPNCSRCTHGCQSSPAGCSDFVGSSATLASLPPVASGRQRGSSHAGREFFFELQGFGVLFSFLFFRLAAAEERYRQLLQLYLALRPTDGVTSVLEEASSESGGFCGPPEPPSDHPPPDPGDAHGDGHGDCGSNKSSGEKQAGTPKQHGMARKPNSHSGMTRVSGTVATESTAAEIVPVVTPPHHLSTPKRATPLRPLPPKTAVNSCVAHPACEVSHQEARAMDRLLQLSEGVSTILPQIRMPASGGAVMGKQRQAQLITSSNPAPTESSHSTLLDQPWSAAGIAPSQAEKLGDRDYPSAGFAPSSVMPVPLASTAPAAFNGHGELGIGINRSGSLLSAPRHPIDHRPLIKKTRAADVRRPLVDVLPLEQVQPVRLEVSAIQLHGVKSGRTEQPALKSAVDCDANGVSMGLALVMPAALARWPGGAVRLGMDAPPSSAVAKHATHSAADGIAFMSSQSRFTSQQVSASRIDVVDDDRIADLVVDATVHRVADGTALNMEPSPRHPSASACNGLGTRRPGSRADAGVRPADGSGGPRALLSLNAKRRLEAQNQVAEAAECQQYCAFLDTLQEAMGLDDLPEPHRCSNGLAVACSMSEPQHAA